MKNQNLLNEYDNYDYAIKKIDEILEYSKRFKNEEFKETENELKIIQYKMMDKLEALEEIIYYLKEE